MATGGPDVKTVKAAGAGALGVRYAPRPEAVLLLLGFVCTAAAKFAVIRASQSGGAGRLLLAVTASDGIVFGVLAAVLALGYAIRPGRAVARVGLVLTLTVVGWSVLNGAWLAVTGVQLQWGVLAVILRHPAEFWPVVPPHLRSHVVLTVAGVLVGLAVGAWVVWRLVRPVTVARGRRAWVWWSSAFACLVVVLALADRCVQVSGGGESIRQVLGYSSHWLLARSLVAGTEVEDAAGADGRRLVYAGERDVVLPSVATPDLPNVVLVALESLSYVINDPCTPEHAAMPTLARLSADSVALTNARAMVPQSGKAFWSILTGTTPDVGPDYVEAVLTDRPVESLATVLRRVGYRSAFFKMAKGTFECAPGLYTNLGFDWAWFRENLKDPSAHVGYLGGDDFRMLDPLLTWAGQDAAPFLVVLTTSVTHDPYAVPAWFEPPADSTYDRYLQTLRYTDAFLAALWERLESRQSARETLLCVLADHGESFRAESHLIRWVPYEEMLRVPWVLHWPGHLPAGTRHDWPVCQLDVTPTLLTLLGFDVSAAGFEGRDALVPAAAGRRSYFSAWYKGSPVGYIEDARKRMYWPGSGQVLEYDVGSDPGEGNAVVVAPAEGETVIAETGQWMRAAHISLPGKRFRQRFVFDHWWVFSSGRYARAYYVP